MVVMVLWWGSLNAMPPKGTGMTCPSTQQGIICQETGTAMVESGELLVKIELPTKDFHRHKAFLSQLVGDIIKINSSNPLLQKKLCL